MSSFRFLFTILISVLILVNNVYGSHCSDLLGSPEASKGNTKRIENLFRIAAHRNFDSDQVVNLFQSSILESYEKFVSGSSTVNSHIRVDSTRSDIAVRIERDTLVVTVLYLGNRSVRGPSLFFAKALYGILSGVNMVFNESQSSKIRIRAWNVVNDDLVPLLQEFGFQKENVSNSNYFLETSVINSNDRNLSQ